MTAEPTKSDKKGAFRGLPGIDTVLREPAMARLIAAYGLGTVKSRLRALQTAWRHARTAPEWSDQPAAYAPALSRALAASGYRPVFNLTGTLLHTNLGRAPLPASAFDAARELVTRPMNLEYDLTTGKRGDREAPVVERLCRLTGAEGALIVNNCAAALMLVLNTFALGRSVPVSRGELIEIGGSFRLPEIMTRAGCRLVEVGATNRTHRGDYAGAIDADTALLLKVFPSNYRIQGFARAPGIAELADLAHAHGLPLCVDLGSGALIDLARWGLPHEPTPTELLAQGADLVLFSGDKLLGGVQSGFIAGRADLVAACNGNPMKRAFRADKVTLALQDQILALYEDPARLALELPMMRWLNADAATLDARGSVLLQVLAPRLPPSFRCAIEASRAEMGSGSLPEETLPSRSLVIDHTEERQLRALADSLRALPTPVIGRLHQGRLWLDLRGAEPLDALSETLSALEPAA
ncbi:MAG: L-seryl-tRNA(Sec) selenium transferase [Gammaproteobacteria bacterium]